MSDFETTESALSRYRPAGPTEAATLRIAALLKARPSPWATPWRRVAAAVIILSASIAWWLLRSETPPPDRQATAAKGVLFGPAIPPQFASDWMNRPRVEMADVRVHADVVVVGFNDWQCPGCLELYAALKAVFAEYERSHPGAVAVLMRDWPWSIRCNSYLSSGIQGHEGACDAAVAVRAARDRGKGDDMVEWLRVNHGRLRDAGADAGALIQAQANAMLPGLDFRGAYGTLMPEIANDTSVGRAAGVNATPTYFINGVKLVTVKAQEVDWGIRLELEKKGR